MGHHYVPQRYLRNFEDPDRPGSIWLHDKRDGAAKLVPIKTVAQAKQFFSAENERLLADAVETPGNAVIRRLTSASLSAPVALSPTERLQLAYYMGTMLKRVPARRRHAMEMIPDALVGVVSNLRSQIQALAAEVRMNPDLVARRLQEVEAAEQRYSREPPAEVIDQIREPWPSENIVRAVFEMTWRVLVTSGPQYFITTDNPAFFFRAFGLGKPQSELCFPLSTTHALHGSWQGAHGDLMFVGASQKMVREINRRLASETERLAFYYRSALWLLNILPKETPYLSVIRW